MKNFEKESSNYHWLQWLYNSSNGIESLKHNPIKPIPPKHGVYIIRSSKPIKRIQGTSNIISIGQSGGGNKKGAQGIGPNLGNPGRLFNVRGLDRWILKRIESLFPNEMFSLECYFTSSLENPKEIETKLLVSYIKDHFEPPPGNSQCVELSLLD